MIVVPNQLYSFHFSQVPGFEQIYATARRHSYAPAGFDARYFADLPDGHRLVSRRRSLDRLPDEATILQQEYELAQSTGDRSRSGVVFEIQTAAHQASLETLQPPQLAASETPTKLARRDLSYRLGSGYVKLDDRKARMADLIAAVSEFFGTPCRCQGDYWYPPGGFRDWHTNKYDATGWRLYIVDVDLPARSYFRIKNPRTQQIETLWDQPGTLNFFHINPDHLLWHCIGVGQANRWSKGFVIPDSWLDTVAARLA